VVFFLPLNSIVPECTELTERFSDDDYPRLIGVAVAFWNKLLQEMGAPPGNQWEITTAAIFDPEVSQEFIDSANADEFTNSDGDIDYAITWNHTTGETAVVENPYQTAPEPIPNPWTPENDYVPSYCDVPDCVECHEDFCASSFWCDNTIYYRPFCNQLPDLDCGGDLPTCVECEEGEECETIFECANKYGRVSYVIAPVCEGDVHPVQQETNGLPQLPGEEYLDENGWPLNWPLPG